MGRVRKTVPAGTKFGQWTIIRETISPLSYQRIFICRCPCGTEKTIRYGPLISGRSKGCSNECRNPIVGTVINNFLVKSKKGNEMYTGVKSAALYLCECMVCGNEKTCTKNRMASSGCIGCRRGGHVREVATKYRELYDPSRIFHTGIPS